MAATTPPPMTTLTDPPPTPLHGARFDDLAAPTRRKSSRLSRRQPARTPSPSFSDHHPPSTSTSAARHPSILQHPSQAISPPLSPAASPQPTPRKKRKNGHSHDVTHVDRLQPDDINTAALTMLPTPAKTPRKKETTSALKPTARALFQPRPDSLDDVMPTPSKKRGKKRQLPSSLDELSPAAESITIYTDVRDRLPEVDESVENPFYDNPGTKAVKARRKNSDKPRRSTRNKWVQDTLEQDQGMIYVFRGRKFFRRFDDDQQDESPDGPDSAVGLPMVDDTRAPRRFLRSSVKPRLLFPDVARAQGPADGGGTTDEEAPTDIEDPEVHGLEGHGRARHGIETSLAQER